MIKKLLLIGVFLLLGGCHQADIAEDIETKYLQQAESIMVDLQAQAYEEVAQQFSQFYLTVDTAQQIEEGWEMMAVKYGELQKIDRYIVTPVNDFYLVKIIVNYENYKAQFTMTFLPNGKLAGLYFR